MALANYLLRLFAFVPHAASFMFAVWYNTIEVREVREEVFHETRDRDAGHRDPRCDI